MPLSRRELFFHLLATGAIKAAPPANTRQATGIRIGEVTPNSAVIWTRRTKAEVRLNDGIMRRNHAPKATAPKPGEDITKFEGACPGANGYARLIVEPDGGKRQSLDWVDLRPDADFSHQFRLDGLKPATSYRFSVETRESKSGRADSSLAGSFRTAPVASAAAPVRFVLLSCQHYSRQDRADGYHIYESIGKRKADFLLSCGDNVYYDSDDPIAASVEAARYHWARMYSLPTLYECLRNVPGYWQKDDHDLYHDDCWPGMKAPKMGSLTFEQGQKVFREQVPSPKDGQPFYRRFRWGTELEVWLPDSRDFRDPNADPDSPTKSIWGAEQKKWLQESLKNSPARWKFLINPNPIVGPDHERKRDNHANPSFAMEGRQFRQWLKDNVAGSVILMNGDRHWQYHSIDPEFGVEEFGCGPASDEHAIAPSRGEDKNYHRFLRIKGGFVAVSVDPREGLVLEHCDVRGNPVYRRALARKS